MSLEICMLEESEMASRSQKDSMNQERKMIFMIRKLTLFLLTACMLLALAACGGGAEEGELQSAH